MTPKTFEAECGRVIEQIDAYMDHELTAGNTASVAEHLAQCEACRRELDSRVALRGRLRAAVRGVTASDDLSSRIAASIASAPRPRYSRPFRSTGIGIAAAVLVVLGGTIAYQLGHLRMTTASQESYIATISRKVGGIMSVGLGDHVHCSVFRKYRTQPPPPEQIAADMGPEYHDLVRIVREHIPADQRIVGAHRCSYHKRKFVHISFIDGTHLGSLVIALRQPGETFRESELVPGLSDPALPVYHAGVQRFQIGGFQTSGHLVYVISDLSRDTNDRILASLTRPVNDFLRKLES